MSDEIERLLVRVEASAAVFERQTKQINRALGGMTAEVRKTRREFKREMDALGRDVYMPVQAASALALGAITGLSINAAKRAEAVSGAFRQTFRDMPEQARIAATAIADEFGRAETDIKDNFTQLRSVLVALGVDAEQSLQIVDALQRRSLDIGAFRDVSDADAFRAVISGITGETEPLKRFGIVVNETAVKAELVRLGFKGAATEASESAKAVARTNIILRQSAEMHGQVAREADTLAEKEKRARAEFTKAAEEFGMRFLPIAAKVLEWAVDALDAFNDLPDGVQNAGLALLALVAASGPIAGAIKGLQALIRAAVAARAALAAVGGSAAGGAAGGAAAGGAAAAAGRLGLGAAAATGAGLLLSTGSFAPAPGPDAFVNDPSFVARRLGESEASWRARGGRTRSEWEAARRAQQNSPQPAASNATPAEQAALAGDFGLSEAQRHGVGGSKSGGRGRRGSGEGSAERIAAARAELEIELAIAQARASGDEAAIRAAEEREQLASLIQQYEDAGHTDAQAKAMNHLALLNQATALAEEREKSEEALDLLLRGRDRQIEREAEHQRLINDQMLDQLSMATELARLSGNEGALRDGERRLWIEHRINELLDLRLATSKEEARLRAEGEWQAYDDAEGQGSFRDMVVRAGEDFGGLAEDAGRAFKRRALEGLADQLWKILSSVKVGEGGGSIASIVGKALSGLFGRRASGGPVMANRPYLVGEDRPEIFVPGTNGNVLPSVRDAASQISGSRAPLTQQFFVDAQGAVLAEALVERLKSEGAVMAMQAGQTAYGHAKKDVMDDLARRQGYSPR